MQIIGGSFGSFSAQQDAIKTCVECLDKLEPCDSTAAGYDAIRCADVADGVCAPVQDPDTLRYLPQCGFEATLGYKLTEAQNNFVDETLKDMGVLVYKDKYCKPIDQDLLLMQEPDKDGNFLVNVYLYGMYKAESQLGEFKYHGDYSNETCDSLDTFRDVPMRLDDLMATLGAVGVVVNDVLLILMLTLFIILERPIGQTFPGNSRVVQEIEGMVMDYIVLKFALSAMTGGLVGLIMVICGVKIGAVWGLLAFMLNFIPNVGSAIAMVLPLPFILLDEEMIAAPLAQTAALLVPAGVQGYVGNALEPGLFGASLNLTEISVLLSLVFFSFIWGLYGAVLSVPILGAAKIVLHHTDHPLAKVALASIRQDEDIDKQKDEKFDEFSDKLDLLRARQDELFAPTQADLDEAAAEEAKSSSDGQQAMD